MLTEEKLWDAISQRTGERFTTLKGLEFTVVVKGNELFVSRKEKSITRATVILAYKTAMRLKEEGIPISGPKKLNCFGASYLYPVFIDLGIL